METLPAIIHPSWVPHLTPLFESKYLKELQYNILPNCKFSPQAKDIFNVFKMPMSEVKVVILGQDPYPQQGQATGYAFAVPEDVPIPFSLQIIRDELTNEGILTTSVFDSPIWRTLQHWRGQGVFLLNTALTVEAGKSNSHASYWDWFTHKVVEIISREIAPIWLLWGANARGISAYIDTKKGFIIGTAHGLANPTKDEVEKYANIALTAPHPAASKHNPENKFIECSHFNLTNQILELRGLSPINW